MAKNRKQLEEIFLASASPEERLDYENRKLRKKMQALEEIPPEVLKGEPGEPGRDGAPGKDGSPDTGLEIVQKINLLSATPEEQIDFTHIKNFPWNRLEKRSDDGLISWGNPLLTIEELDGSPSVSQVTGLIFANGSVTDNGDGTVTISSGGTVGPGTINEIAYFDTANTVASLAVATYPSLTELSYVKGVTSAIQTQLNARATTAGALTQFVGNGNWKVFYSDGSGDVQELSLGADGTFLKSNGAALAPSFSVPAGTGDVSKVGTPVDNQVGVWTGDGTIEGTAGFTFDGAILGVDRNTTGLTPLFAATNQGTGDAMIRVGIVGDSYAFGIDNSNNDLFTLAYGSAINDAALGTNNLLTIDSVGVVDFLGSIKLAGATILSDSGGTATLANIDALDATTESTIEAAIDTLANLTSIQGRTMTLADAGADALFAWDDSANAYQNLSQADARVVLGLGTAAYVATDLPDLNEATIEAAIDTLANLTSVQGQSISISAPFTLPADPNADRMIFWDDSAGATAYLAPGNSLAITTTTIDTIQDIRTTASPQFVGIELNHASANTLTASGGHMTIEGATVWDSGNDGTASGLDADLLDGKNTGTSGNTVPLLDGTNTWSGLQTLTLAGVALRVLNTTDNASVQVAKFEGDRATIADNDEGYLSLILSDSGGNQDEQARITFKATTVAAGATQDGQLILSTLLNNSLTTVLTLGGATLLSTFAGDVALGVNNLTLTGSLAATGARVTKGWFTDIESTNMPTVGGTSLASTFAPLASPTFTGTVTLPTTSLSGVMTLAENTSLALDPAGSADGKYTGITIAGTAGTTLAFGDLIYLQASDSRWELADADAAATAGDVQLGMCVLAAAADGSATTVLLFGNIRADANFPALTIGGPAYVSTTPGDIQTAQPSGTDDVIRRVGFALTADELLFNPSNDYITHT